MDRAFSSYGIAAAIAEITLRNQAAVAAVDYDAAEKRLQEKMRPARLSPLSGLNPEPGTLNPS